MSFGGFQAEKTSQSAEIDESTPWVAAGDGDLTLLQESIARLGTHSVLNLACHICINM